MKSIIIILLMLFTNVLFSQDSSFVGDWATKSESTDKDGNKYFHRLAIFIHEDSTFKIMTTHKTLNVFNHITEASFMIAEGSWTEVDSILQMKMKYKLTNEFEIKYFKNFPKMALVGHSDEKTRLVESIYRWQTKTKVTEIYKIKTGIKSKEFFEFDKKEEKSNL